MHNFVCFWKLMLLSAVLWAPSVQARDTGNVCGPLFAESAAWAPSIDRTPSERFLHWVSDGKPLKVLTFNAEKFAIGEHAYQSEASPQKIRQIIDLLNRENPDIVVWTEVIGRETLENLSQMGAIRGKYAPALIRGNDTGMIDIGFFIRRDLPLKFDLYTNKDVTWKDPVSGARRPLFTRDLPVVVFSIPDRLEPVLILYGNHAKSMLSRDGDRRSQLLRRTQYQAIGKIAGNNSQYVQQQFHLDVPQILAGDFNCQVPDASELNPISGIFVDSFVAAAASTPTYKRITLLRFGHDGRANSGEQLDSIQVSRNYRKSVLQARVSQFTAPNGTIIGPPSSYMEQARFYPSNHMPITATFDKTSLFSETIGRLLNVKAPAPVSH